MNEKIFNFIVANSPDGGFLQSDYWRKLQESCGRKTFHLEEKDENGDTIILANMIVHNLPVVGDYFYIPRGPIIQVQSSKLKAQSSSLKLKVFLNDLVELAGRNDIGWIRVEPSSKEELDLIKENFSESAKIKKAPVDVQPGEILILDISGNEENILSAMKQKTRYNIRLAEKRNVHVTCNTRHVTQENLEEFLRLIKITARRDKIRAHPENYYRKMFETIPPEILKLYVAEYAGKVISANIISFFGKTATYMHGASDNEHRNLMAPYLLQWRQILDAKKTGCERYDLGGVKTGGTSNFKFQISNSWSGITRFKAGFAPDVDPIRFPGDWDIVLNSGKYNLYRILQKIKRIF